MNTPYTEYENWALEPVTLPTRSRLYPLPPIGLGTPQVESLTSYLMRLAAAHCLTPGTLYQQVIFPRIKAAMAPPEKPLQPASLAVQGVIRDAQSWNSIHQTAAHLVQALEQLTCVANLHLLTWLPWESVIASQHLLRRARAWCPRCLAAWRQTGQTLYEPLCWTLQAVTVCALHHCALVEVCPGCQRNLRPLSAHTRAGYCSWCQQWLGEDNPGRVPVAPVAESAVEQERLWAAASMGGVIVRAATLSASSATSWNHEGVENLIHLLRQSPTLASPNLLGLRHKILSLWQSGRRVPRLAFILQCCFQFKLPVAEFLTAMLERQPWGRPTLLPQADLATRRGAVKVWETTVQQTLADALTENPPPPLSAVAERLFYASPNPLYLKHGEISRQIAERYRQWVNDAQAAPPLSNSSQGARLEQLIAEELKKECPCRPAQLARQAGYEYVALAQRQAPTLWRSLCDKYRERRKTEQTGRQALERQVLNDALREDPTPSPKEIARRLGDVSLLLLRQRYPKEWRSLKEKREQQKKEQLAKLEAQLQAALQENPPRPLGQLALSIRYNRKDCYRRWPALCYAIARRYLEHQKECADNKRRVLGEQVCQIMQELHQAGLQPTKSRIFAQLHDLPTPCFVALTNAIKEARQALNLRTW